MGTPKLFILSEQMRGASFSLTLDKYSIGRSDDCDVCMADPTVSGHHCFLVKQEDGNYTVTDNGSTNGTKVNERKVEEGDVVKLRNGDILQVGSVEILYDDIQGDRVESRTISVINLDDTGTGEFNTTTMKNLGEKFHRQTSMLRDNKKHNKVFAIILSLLGVLGIAMIIWVLLRGGGAQ